MNKSIYGVIVDYLEDNYKQGVDYLETIEYLEEVLKELKKMYVESENE